MEYLVNSDKCVTGFCLDINFVDYISNNGLFKLERKSKKNNQKCKIV